MSGTQLPVGWQWVPLGEATTIVGGSTPASSEPSYWNGEVNWITPTDLGVLEEPFIRGSNRRISKKGLANCSASMLPVGTVVMSSRAPIGHLGIAAVPLCTNQGCKSFVPGPDLDTRFLYWSLRSRIAEIRALGSGNTFAEVSKGVLSAIPIAYPPLPEQRRIAGVIDAAIARAEDVARAADAQWQCVRG